MLAGGVLRPLDTILPHYFAYDDAKDFTVPCDNPPTSGLNMLIADAVFTVSSAVFPRGSWPWTLCRKVALTVAARDADSQPGEPPYALNSAVAGSGPSPVKQPFTQILYDLSMAKDSGPLRCLAAGWLASWHSPWLSKVLGDQGLQRLTPADFRRDCNFLAQFDERASTYVGPIAQALDTLDDQDLAALFPKIPPPRLRPILRAAGDPALGHGGNQFGHLLDALWQNGLGDEIKGALTQLVEQRPAAQPELTARPDEAKRR